MLVYYGWLFFILTAAGDKKMITHPYAAQLFIPAGWFLLGQIIIWALFFKKIKEVDNPINDSF
jgi:hypothetical protein